MRPAVLLAIAGLAAPLRAGPAEIRFEHIGQGTALGGARASCVFQDSRGFLWFGSRAGGLFRYDGVKLKRYVHDPKDAASLSGNRVWSIAEDRSGALWIATFGDGLNRFDPALERFERFRHRDDDRDSLANDRIGALLVDSAGTLWVGTFGGGLDRVELRGGRPRFAHLRHDPKDPASLAHDEIWNLVEDRRGRLWVAMRYGGVDHVALDDARGGKGRFTHLGGLPTPEIWSMARGAGDAIWVGTFERGLVRVNAVTGAVEPITAASGDPIPDRIRSVLEDSAGVVWFGGTEGIYRLDLKTLAVSRHVHRDQDPTSPFTDHAVAIFEDAEHLLWFATWGGGILKVDPRTARFGLQRHHDDDPGSPVSSTINTVLEDPKGRLWIGTGVGLDMRPPGATAFRHFRAGPPPALADDRISSLLLDRDGTLWISTWSRGLHSLAPSEMDAASPRFVRYGEQPEHPLGQLPDRVTAMLQDRGGALWLASRNHGAYRWDGRTITHFQHSDRDPSSLSYDVAWSVFEDASGGIWIGTEQGLNRYEPKSGKDGGFTRFGADDVSSIAEDSHGDVWIGTLSSGLLRLDHGGRLQRYREKDGLISDVISRVLVDRHDRLWIATDRGLDRFTPSTGSIIHYDERDGLQSDRFYAEVDGAAFRTADGRLYFGGPRGFNVFDPDRIEENRRLPPVVLTDFLLFNRPAAVSSDGPLKREISKLPALHLDYTQELFALEFASLAYRRPEKNRYAYKLEGFDRDWIETTAADRKAVYTRLPPGHYVFRVRASNEDGRFAERGASLPIAIEPPWWRTWWFRSLLALAFVVSPLLVLQARNRRLERNRLELQAQVAERTRELVAKGRTIELQAAQLEQQNEVLRENVRLQEEVERMSRHDLKTPLSAIISIPKLLLARASRPREETELLKVVQDAGYRMLDMVNLSLDLLKMERGTYAFRPRTLDVYEAVRRVVVDLKSHASARRVTIGMRRNGDAPLLARAEELLTYSMLGNLVKNALEASPDGGEVTISCALLDREVSIHIHNMGTVPEEIRDGFFEKFRSSGKSGGTGFGNYSARLMAETQRGRIAFESSEASGTTVTVILEATSRQSAAGLAVLPERSAPAVLPPAGPVDQELGRLVALLTEGSLEAQAAFEAVKERLMGCGVDDGVAELEARIMSFDYGTAAESLDELRRRLGRTDA